MPNSSLSEPRLYAEVKIAVLQGNILSPPNRISGNRGQYVIVVPTHDTVIVRRGLDYCRGCFNRWDLAREVLKAIPETGDGD